jgi:hypothetical protein
MKRALRNTDTSMFLKSDLAETDLIDQAHVFENYQEAFDFCKDNQLKRVELVVRMSESYEFTVEVPGPDIGAVEQSHSTESAQASEYNELETPVSAIDIG